MRTRKTLFILPLTLIFPIMAKSQVKIQQTAGRDALGEFAPEFAHLNDDILFGEVWNCNICFDNGLGKSKMKRKA